MAFSINQKVRVDADIPMPGFDIDWNPVVNGSNAEAKHTLHKESIGTITEVMGGGWYKIMFQVQERNLSFRPIIAVIHEYQLKGIDVSVEPKKKPIREVHVATIQIAVEVDSDQAPEDLISELLHDVKGLVDWQFLKLSGQYLYPTTRYISADYEEGELFN